MRTAHRNADQHAYPHSHAYIHSDVYPAKADGDANIRAYTHAHTCAANADQHTYADIRAHEHSNAYPGRTKGDANGHAHSDIHAHIPSTGSGHRHGDAYIAQTYGNADVHSHAIAYVCTNAYAAEANDDTNVFSHVHSCRPVSRVKGYGGDGNTLSDAVSYGCYGDRHLDKYTTAFSYR